MKSYFKILPREVQINLAKYLPRLDLLSLIKTVPSLRYLLKEKRVFEKLCYYQAYGFRRIDTCIQPNIVTSLNVSGIYWLDAAYLQSSIRKFENLTALYAVDTQLSFSFEDCCVYSALKKLCTIAMTITSYSYSYISYQRCDCSDCIIFHDRIKNLYSHVDLQKYDERLIHLMSWIPNLEDLWIIDSQNTDYSKGRYYELKCLYVVSSIPPSVRKCTLKFSLEAMSMPIQKFSTEQFKIVYKSNGYYWYEKSAASCTIDPLYDNAPNVWKHIFDQNSRSVPFGPNDLKKLAAPSHKIENYQLEEANFKLSDCCNCEMAAFVSPELIANNLRYLKKLSVPSCFCDQLHENFLTAYYKPEKRRVENRISKLEQIVGSCRLIETIEIWKCDNAAQGKPSLDAVSHLKSLKHLTLVDMDLQAHKTALMAICENSPQLLTLKIKNSTLPSYLNSAINFCNELKDFKLEIYEYMCISEVLRAFTNHTINKIERTAISRSFAERPLCWYILKNFFLKSPKLKFFYISAANFTEHDRDWVMHIARDVYLRNAEQIFVVTNLPNPSELDIPLIHKSDMIWFETKVAVFDIFNGFVN